MQKWCSLTLILAQENIYAALLKGGKEKSSKEKEKKSSKKSSSKVTQRLTYVAS